MAAHISRARLCSGLSTGRPCEWRSVKSAARAFRGANIMPPAAASPKLTCRRVNESAMMPPEWICADQSVLALPATKIMEQCGSPRAALQPPDVQARDGEKKRKQSGQKNQERPNSAHSEAEMQG